MQLPRLTTSEWKAFIDTNEVSNTRLLILAQKIKSNSLLTNNELAIYQAKAKEVEEILKEL